MTHNLKRDDLDRLCAVTEVAWAAASQGLRQKLALESAAASQVEDLARSRRKAHESLVGADTPDAGMIASVSGWMHWAERERQRLNIELARVRAALDAEQAKARKAFGQREAARTLRERALAQLHKRRSV